MKKIVISISFLLIIGIIGGATYLVMSRSETPVKPATKPLTPKPPVATHQPTEEITFPDGSKHLVVAHQLLARITDQNTVKSFGSNIKSGPSEGVYIITVQGDLLKAQDEIKQKPGVVWVATNNINPH